MLMTGPLTETLKLTLPDRAGPYRWSPEVLAEPGVRLLRLIHNGVTQPRRRKDVEAMLDGTWTYRVSDGAIIWSCYEWLAPKTHKIKIEVDDGVGKIVKKTFQVVVRDPPTNPSKQVKPRAAKIKGTQALVGVELDLPLQISDQNGDALTVTVDDSVPPFTYGATFDSGTNTFSWTDSELSHIGSYTIQFNISDGVATVKHKVKIKLVSSLYIF